MRRTTGRRSRRRCGKSRRCYAAVRRAAADSAVRGRDPVGVHSAGRDRLTHRGRHVISRVPLREIAHARAIDKGDISNISVWVYDLDHYGAVKAQLTPERIQAVYPGLVTGAVEHYELEHLAGFNFVLRAAIEGGVNTSLNLDSHGKSWSFLILALEIDLA
jgi:hypothetical protein